MLQQAKIFFQSGVKVKITKKNLFNQLDRKLIISWYKEKTNQQIKGQSRH